MNIVVITYPVPKNVQQILNHWPIDKVIVVDKALHEIFSQKIVFDIAVGDFDSFDKNHLNDFETIDLPSEKNETDTYMAVKYASEYLPDNIYLIGGLTGTRVDHFIANINLLVKFDELVIVDENNFIQKYGMGTHVIMKQHKYISFYSIEPAVLTIRQVKYELTNYQLALYDSLNTSNEIIGNQMELRLDKGIVISIQSSD